MFNVCPRCGRYSAEKETDPSGPFAVCPHCGHGHPFLRLPLFVITGASGAGKTTIGLGLVETLRGQAVVMETDILWRSEFASPEDDYRSYREMWLRVATNIGQAGLPVVLVGTAIPEQFEGLPERRYFSEINYIGVVAEGDELVRRLRLRPEWRKSSSEEFIQRMVDFNQWLQDNASGTKPSIALLDTTGSDPEQSAQEIAEWIRERLGSSAIKRG